jgi:hypothetical protein
MKSFLFSTENEQKLFLNLSYLSESNIILNFINIKKKFDVL